MNCKNCVFWSRKQEKLVEYYSYRDVWVDGDSNIRGRVVEHKDSLFGRCSNNNFVNSYFPDDNVSANSLMYFPEEYGGAEFVTGEDFGCIHFKDKNEQ